MSETKELTELTIPEVEERWQKAMLPAARIEARIGGLRRSARRYRKAGGHYEAQAQELEQEAYELEQGALQEAIEAEAPYVAEYKRRGGWTRYWHVAGGHLHEIGCSTLTPGRTLIGLVIEASGMTAAEVVERFQYTACTHCFPEAPVEAKLTPEQEGLCELSGTYAGEYVAEKWRGGRWASAAVAPGAKCPRCGYVGAITKSGKFRKHKPGEGRET